MKFELLQHFSIVQSQQPRKEEIVTLFIRVSKAVRDYNCFSFATPLYDCPRKLAIPCQTINHKTNRELVSHVFRAFHSLFVFRRYVSTQTMVLRQWSSITK